MKFFIKMNPPTATAQEHQVRVINGRPMFYDPPKLKLAKRQLTFALRFFKPSDPFQGPVELHTLWKFPKGKSHKHNQWRITRPDTDNLQKMLKDCMTAVGFWKDDAQVVRELSEKKWSDEPCGIEIEINELPALCKEDA